MKYNMEELDRKVQKLWPNRWTFNRTTWSEDDPLMNPRMSVSAIVMEYLIKEKEHKSTHK